MEKRGTTLHYAYILYNMNQGKSRYGEIEQTIKYRYT